MKQLHALAFPMKFFALILILSFQSPAFANNEPISGDEFKNLLGEQQFDLQERLNAFYSYSDGFQVTGPLDPLNEGKIEENLAMLSVRVICPDLKSCIEAVDKLRDSEDFEVETFNAQIIVADKLYAHGYRGCLAHVIWNGEERTVQFCTIQHTRWLIWAQKVAFDKELQEQYSKLGEYAIAVSDYFFQIDNGRLDAAKPKAADMGIPASLEIYAPAPDYVISGYDNYKAYLSDNKDLKTSFAVGIVSFVPGDSLLNALKVNAPQVAYPNKEAAHLQGEYRKFFQRGGLPNIIQTLDKEKFESLNPGEYFFAVGLNGSIRFGRELLREEVKRIEEETGNKVPRANHAFLFPGEPILTAGAFFIEGVDPSRIVSVNAQSGHYFYSNISSTVREDISERSNDYLLSLGHFFNALDRLGIEYESILISKF